MLLNDNNGKSLQMDVLRIENLGINFVDHLKLFKRDFN